MAFQEGSTLLINHNTGYIYLEECACTKNACVGQMVVIAVSTIL